MSYWDGEKIVVFPDEQIDGHSGWVRKDCGCCAGVEWGGDSPTECSHCMGTGQYCEHMKTGTLALYPGGPLLGSLPKEDSNREEA